jgi:hypothetical protein
VSGLTVPSEKVVVVASAELENGTPISQSYEFDVPKGAADAPILGLASQKFRAAGGFFVDDENGNLLFYLAYRVKGPIRFSIKRVLIVS